MNGRQWQRRSHNHCLTILIPFLREILRIRHHLSSESCFGVRNSYVSTVFSGKSYYRQFFTSALIFLHKKCRNVSVPSILGQLTIWTYDLKSVVARCPSRPPIFNAPLLWHFSQTNRSSYTPTIPQATTTWVILYPPSSFDHPSQHPSTEMITSTSKSMLPLLCVPT
jgi:hypothetical protein